MAVYPAGVPAERSTVLGRKENAGAFGMFGVTVAERVTWPLKPRRLTGCSCIDMSQSWRVVYDPQRLVVKSGRETGDTVTGGSRGWVRERTDAVMLRS